MTTPERRRRTLGDFLRAHRARLPPASVGLAGGRRRRTPGLRREEVAQACGMSATWITWLEQGRDVSASPRALAALAAALQLTPAERAYLFELAEKHDPAMPETAAGDGMDAPPALADAVQAVTVPAYVLDRAWTARTWNSAAARLFVGWLDGTNDKNLLRYVFLSRTARKIIPDWDVRARRVLAEFRAESSRYLDDPALTALVGELSRESPLFARGWREHDVVERAGGERSFDHPRRGRVRYEQMSFTVASRPDFKLVMLLPRSTRRKKAIRPPL
ncbi:MAG: helix-turn-helix domain-containing protein [Alphaproteobacteria bacterium]|nr:helix-turn-helix domain-containing protein [Alphaproteobacteria bacterium]